MKIPIVSKPYKINPNSEAVKKLLESYSVSQDFEFAINSGGESVTAYVQHFSAMMVEKQDELIMKLITHVANEEFVNITIDRSKLLEIFGKHTPKKVRRLRDGAICQCGECSFILPTSAVYCQRCGQKIDWDHDYFKEKRYDHSDM